MSYRVHCFVDRTVGDTHYRKGVYWFKREKFMRAYKHFRKSSYPQALNILGCMYYSGMGVAKDACMAHEYYRKALIRCAIFSSNNIRTLWNTFGYHPDDYEVDLLRHYTDIVLKQADQREERQSVCKVISLSFR